MLRCAVAAVTKAGWRFDYSGPGPKRELPFRELHATRRAEEKHNAEAAAKHTAETAATAQPEPVAPTKTLTAAPVPPTTQASESTPLSPENGFVFSGLPTEAEIRAILEATPPGLMRNDTANITAGM
jgi:hypothetical protein